jgi:hypothetical protein
MSDSSQRPPHFLRVVRAPARVSGVAVASEDGGSDGGP